MKECKRMGVILIDSSPLFLSIRSFHKVCRVRPLGRTVKSDEIKVYRKAINNKTLTRCGQDKSCPYDGLFKSVVRRGDSRIARKISTGFMGHS